MTNSASETIPVAVHQFEKKQVLFFFSSENAKQNLSHRLMPGFFYFIKKYVLNFSKPLCLFDTSSKKSLQGGSPQKSETRKKRKRKKNNDKKQMGNISRQKMCLFLSNSGLSCQLIEPPTKKKGKKKGNFYLLSNKIGEEIYYPVKSPSRLPYRMATINSMMF